MCAADDDTSEHKGFLKSLAFGYIQAITLAN